MTCKQRLEIDFLIKYFGGKEDDSQSYLKWVVNGDKGEANVFNTTNSLFLAKRKLDIALKQWRKDLGTIVFYEDLVDTFEGHPFALKILKQFKS